VKEFALKEMYRSPNGTIRNILGGVIFREPIVISNIPRLVPGWTKPIVIGRHAFGDQYRATDTLIPGEGKLTLTFTTKGGGEPLALEIFDFTDPGVALYNLDDSIREFARARCATAWSGATRCTCRPRTRSSSADGRFRISSRRSTTTSSRPSSRLPGCSTNTA
jgi:isocitrate dehydrogenase